MADGGGAPLLELRDVSKNFGSLTVLRHISMALKGGESAAIVGPSGAGKSTLLHIAGLMEKPTAGDVYLGGRSALRLNDTERALLRLNTIGFLFQFHYLLPEFNVLENVLMPCQLAGDDLLRASPEAQRILKRLGLGERLNHRPSQISGGEQQRAALARALVRKPQILLCDEPTGNLDQRTAQEMTELMWEEAREAGTATVIVTHNEALARQAGIVYHLSGEKGSGLDIGQSLSNVKT